MMPLRGKCTVLHSILSHELTKCCISAECLVALSPLTHLWWPLDFPKVTFEYGTWKGKNYGACIVTSNSGLCVDISNLFLSIPALSINKILEKGGITTWKLIGYSSLVYSVSFDPLSGSAAPPEYLLSSYHQCYHTPFVHGHNDKCCCLLRTSKPCLGCWVESNGSILCYWQSCLRVYAGHISDIDICGFFPWANSWSQYSFSSVLNFTQILFTSQQVPVTGLQDCGMSSEDCVCACSLDIKGLSLTCDQSRWQVFCYSQYIFPYTICMDRQTILLDEDLAINLWDLGSGRQIKKMTGHAVSIYSLIFNKESSLLVSGGADWTVWCWDVKSASGKPHENGSMSNGDWAIPKYFSRDNKTWRYPCMCSWGIH